MTSITLPVDTCETLGETSMDFVNLWPSIKVLMMDTWKGRRSFVTETKLDSGYNYDL